MKVLIVNISDIVGGAGRAAYRLHQALLKQGVDSQMLVQSKEGDDYTVLGKRSNIQKILDQVHSMFDTVPVHFYKSRSKTFFSPSWVFSSRIVNKINKLNPDIVHLHWICKGMIRIESLTKIRAPVIWSLHDMWAFTGGCHYDEECNAYKNECGNCKVLGSHKENNLSRKVFARKQKIFLKIDNMTVVGLSRWLIDCSKSSTLLKDKPHINLPNPINTALFRPFDKNKARELWNLPKGKQLILFGAMDATSDPRKGFNELCEALHKLNDSNIEFVIFGSSEPEKSQNFGFKTHYLGHLHDDVSLVTLYSAVDVMVVPSLQENLSNVILESLACATPVVGFDIGGNSDLIDHKKNGYLAQPFDSSDLAKGIKWVLNNDSYNELCQNAREKVLKEFDSVVVANKYIQLYRESLTND